MAAYLKYVILLKGTFVAFELVHVPREQNARADLLAKLASLGKGGWQRTIIQETLKALRTTTGCVEEIQQVSVFEGGRRGHRSLTQETLRVPKISAYHLSVGEPLNICLVDIAETWMTPYRRYLADALLLHELMEAKIVKKNTYAYILWWMESCSGMAPLTLSCSVWVVSSVRVSWLSSMKVSVGVTSVDELSHQRLFEQGITGWPWGRTTMQTNPTTRRLASCAPGGVAIDPQPMAFPHMGDWHPGSVYLSS